jgi:hypothetical protein
MGVGQRQPYLFEADVADLDTEESQDLMEMPGVNSPLSISDSQAWER